MSLKLRTGIILGILLCPALFALGKDSPDGKEPPARPRAEQKQAAAEKTPRAAKNPLDQLQWMIGRWVDKDETSKIKTNCQWTKNSRFITQSFVVEVDGQVVLEGTQVIGWDPISKQIRSWMFDSEGGYGEGLWTRDGKHWLVRFSQVSPEGERASAINIYTPVDENSFRWKSTNRESGGQLLPNIPEVTVVRAGKKSN